jgi:aryl-alcohol dehydrogenase
MGQRLKINAAVLRDRPIPALEALDLAEPQDDEILVRIVATGICHTDLKFAEAGSPLPRPIVLGHEGSGFVERVGSRVGKVARGDPVVLTFASCGHCPSCIAGMSCYCDEMRARNFGGKRPDGSVSLAQGNEAVHGNFFGQSSFATYALATERNVVKVRCDAKLELLGPLGCGIQTGAGAVLNALQIKPGASFVVFGAGAVGLSAVMAAKLSGAAPIIAVDILPQRLALARELGAAATIDAKAENVPAAIARQLKRGADFSLDTSGTLDGMRQAIECLATLGTVGILASSNLHKEIPVNVLHLMTGGRTIKGILQGESNPDLFIPKLIDLHMAGQFPFDRLVKFYPAADIAAAFHDSESGATIKPVLRFA